jgi:hypothetical protein
MPLNTLLYYSDVYENNSGIRKDEKKKKSEMKRRNNKNKLKRKCT